MKKLKELAELLNLMNMVVTSSDEARYAKVAALDAMVKSIIRDANMKVTYRPSKGYIVENN